MIRRLTVIFLLLCATTQCVLSIFFVNLSWLNLPKYAAGTEFLPFQRRLLLVPFVRWAQNFHGLQAVLGPFIKGRPQYEPLTAAKLGCILLSVVLVNGLGLWTIRMARRVGIRHWWLLWALIVAILFASYGARFEQALWYPYDLPHMVLFGAASLLLLVDSPWAFLGVLAIDVFVRETSIALIVLALLLHFRSRTWQVVISAGTALWLYAQWLAHHLYPDNIPQPNIFPWYRMMAPWHWPQLFSIVGYLWIPVWLGARYLQPKQRLALYGATGVMLLIFHYAVWNETRVWVEWTVLFATLAALEIEAVFSFGRDENLGQYGTPS